MESRSKWNSVRFTRYHRTRVCVSICLMPDGIRVHSRQTSFHPNLVWQDDVNKRILFQTQTWHFCLFHEIIWGRFRSPTFSPAFIDSSVEQELQLDLCTSWFILKVCFHCSIFCFCFRYTNFSITGNRRYKCFFVLFCFDFFFLTVFWLYFQFLLFPLRIIYAQMCITDQDMNVRFW